MKIDINCKFCNSVLRVDAEHAGKKLRCPTCRNLTAIPASQDDVNEPLNQPTPASQSPEIGSLRESAHQQQPDQQSHPKNRSNSVLSLVIGIFGVIVSMLCGSCFVPLLFLANWVGLYLAIRSSGGVKQAAVTMNLLALAIELFILFSWFG